MLFSTRADASKCVRPGTTYSLVVYSDKSKDVDTSSLLHRVVAMYNGYNIKTKKHFPIWENAS